MAGKKKGDLLHSAVKDHAIGKKTDINAILKSMSESGGFESRNLADGVDILGRMMDEPKCTKFLSFVAALMSTGARGIVRDMLKNKMFDVE